MLNDLNEEDEEALLDIYQETEPLVFSKQAARQPVSEQAIICDVNVSELVVKKGAKAQVKVAK